MTASGEILFLCHRIPFPPDRGDKIRSCHMLKAMSAMAPVHVGCFADDARDMSFADEMAAFTTSQCVVMRDRSKLVAGLSALLHRTSVLNSVYESASLRDWVGALLRDRPIRAIVGYSVQMARYVPEDLPSGIRFVMDFVDFDSAKYAAYGATGGGPMGWVNRREGRVLHTFEQQVAHRADISTFISTAEVGAFRRAGGVEECAILPLENGVDLDFFDPQADFAPVGKVGDPLIVFTGQMDYRPNIEAAECFAQEALPHIRAVLPTATFAIVGRSPAPQVEALAKLPGVVVTGGVPDVRGWLAAADVVVAPLRIARGIQNKVLEAMAMGRPVVASPEAAEGIDAADGEHLVIAGDSRAEADAVLGLIEDRAEAQRMGRAARARMEQRYDWAATLAPLREMIFGRAGAMS